MRRAPKGILPVIAVERGSPRPLYRQLYEGYREAIVERRLLAGQRLPSTRSLAKELRISRIPVLSAFEQLSAEGYFETRVGSGTFVAGALPDERPAPAERGHSVRPGRRPVSRGPELLLRKEPEPWHAGSGAFRTSEVAVDQFPFAVWSSLLNRHARNPHRSLLRYGDPMGWRPFREAVAGYLRTARAVRCEADQILVVSGSQQALEVSARALLDPGSPVWVEEPGYGGARDVLATAGARLVPVPVDDEGLDLHAGIARCPRPRAVHVTPSHQYPLGVTMSAPRRLMLLEWARRSGTWILEDDYDSEYRYESLPVSALQGLDRDSRVIYIGTFSKVLFPALRVGYVVVPPDLVRRFAVVREAMDIFPATLSQAVLADFIEEGHFARHLRRMRQLYRERRTVLVEALRGELEGTLRVLGDQAGVHLVVTLAKGQRDRGISLSAARRGLSAMPLSSCYLGKATRQGLVLGYGGTSAKEIPAAVRLLRSVIPAAGRHPEPLTAKHAVGKARNRPPRRTLGGRFLSSEAKDLVSDDQILRADGQTAALRMTKLRDGQTAFSRTSIQGRHDVQLGEAAGLIQDQCAAVTAYEDAAQPHAHGVARGQLPPESALAGLEVQAFQP